MSRLHSEDYRGGIVPPAQLCKFLSEKRQPPKLMRDWEEEYQKKMRLYEFRIIMRGGVLNQEEVDELLAMKFYKDYLYGKWIMEDLDEDGERQKLKELGYFTD